MCLSIPERFQWFQTIFRHHIEHAEPFVLEDLFLFGEFRFGWYWGLRNRLRCRSRFRRFGFNGGEVSLVLCAELFLCEMRYFGPGELKEASCKLGLCLIGSIRLMARMDGGWKNSQVCGLGKGKF
jgi:hypothetical protein